MVGRKAGKGESICTIPVGDNAATEKANAKLIAAAPEVAESAAAFLDWFVTFIGRDAYVEIRSPELNALIRALDKAGVKL
jgi:hypothetical protein